MTAEADQQSGLAASFHAHNLYEQGYDLSIKEYFIRKEDRSLIVAAKDQASVTLLHFTPGSEIEQLRITMHQRQSTSEYVCYDCSGTQIKKNRATLGELRRFSGLIK